MHVKLNLKLDKNNPLKQARIARDAYGKTIPSGLRSDSCMSSRMALISFSSKPLSTRYRSIFCLRTGACDFMKSPRGLF